MTTAAPASPHALLTARLATRPATPLLTLYDDVAGVREELSAATLANWVAKAANLLVDEADLDVGRTLGIVLPLHWRAAAFALAGWAAGAVVTADPGADVVVDEALAFDTARILAEPDAFVPVDAPDPAAPAIDVDGRRASGAELAAAARAVGLPDGSRVLSTLAPVSWDGLVTALLAPLAAGGSAVWVRAAGAADPQALARRAAAERATHSAGADVAGLARLPASSPRH